MRIVLHGTNGFPDGLVQKCISMGVTKINVNKLVLEEYNEHLKANARFLPQTKLIDEGTELIVKLQEHQMIVAGSAGKA